MVKNYFHNLIRLRKGKPSLSQVYWIIVILNKHKTSSHKQVEQLGFFKQGKLKLFSINYQRLAYYLNKGYKLKNSVKKYIYWHSIIYNKYYKLNKLKKMYYFLFKKKGKKKIKNKKFNILNLYKHYLDVANKRIDIIVKIKEAKARAKAKAEIKRRKIIQARILKKARAYAKKHCIPFVYKSSNYPFKYKPPVKPEIINRKDIRLNTKKIKLKDVFLF